MKKVGYEKNVMDREFFDRPADKVARELLGCYLVHETAEEVLRGRIVETEAYFGEEDPGSHAYNGRTERTKLMFDSYGKAYVYLCYGMYDLLNVTTSSDSVGAVLIRAVEPVSGVETMKKNREKDDIMLLTDGPGKLTQAFDIDRSLNGKIMVSGELRIEEGESPERIGKSGRIGISEGGELMLRFFDKVSDHISF